MAVSANRLELLQIADAVAREALIDKEIVIAAMEDAMAKAARSRYGTSSEIRAELDPKTGETRLHRVLLVVDKVENDATEISVEAAQRRNPAAQAGDTILDPLPPFDFGRIAAQTGKQVIMQKVRDAQRERQYEEYKDRIGEIIHGIVKRVEYGNVIVDLGRAEAIVRRDEGLPREVFRPNDRIRAYLYDVRREARGPQLFLSRTHPQFMAKLFAQEVPEIYDGVIEIRAVARDPGSRAKIAVISKDSSIDPVGACVGMRGSRVQAVVQELQGEKIDIIPWSNDTANFIVNALAPAEVSKVLMDEEKHKTEVVVPDDQLSLAIGRRGQNVRLASMLTGWAIDILTEKEESERRQEEFRTRSALFVEALDVDDVIAGLLVTEGFSSIEELAMNQYLDVWRPVLMARKGRWTRPVGTRVWVSGDGSPLGEEGISGRIQVRYGAPLIDSTTGFADGGTMGMEDPDGGRPVLFQAGASACTDGCSLDDYLGMTDTQVELVQDPGVELVVAQAGEESASRQVRGGVRSVEDDRDRQLVVGADVSVAVLEAGDRDRAHSRCQARRDEAGVGEQLAYGSQSRREDGGLRRAVVIEDRQLRRLPGQGHVQLRDALEERRLPWHAERLPPRL